MDPPQTIFCNIIVFYMIFQFTIVFSRVIVFDFSQKGVGKGSAIETVAPQYLLSSFYPLFVWLVLFLAVGLCPITSDVTEIKLL